jgi:hypothetical protein
MDGILLPFFDHRALDRDLVRSSSVVEALLSKETLLVNQNHRFSLRKLFHWFSQICFWSGLQLILNVNQDEYISEGDDAAGMRLVVHEPLRMPFPEDEGLAINPGQTTSIGMQRVCISVFCN